MSLVGDAIRRYHDLLTADVAESSHAHLRQAQERRGLVFGGRALCTVLRPRFLTVDEYLALQRRIRPLLAAFRRAHDRAMGDAAFRAEFGLADWEEVLLGAAPGYANPTPTSRLDFFWAPHSGSLGLTEYNAETPAGAAYGDALTEAFLDLPAMREFLRHYEALPLPSAAGVIGAFMDAWHEFSGSHRLPRIAILDWSDVPTITEFALYRERLGAMGIECVIDDPRNADYRNGKLIVQGAPVGLVYKRVLISELVEEQGIEGPVVRAVRDGAVCLVDGFRCKVLHKKSSLAVLSDETHAGMFHESERAAIADCIPWTRVVRERHTTYAGREVDLIPFIVLERERFVLKPNDDYGGKGITLGWSVTAAEWTRAVQDALEAPYIVQERVEIPSEAYPGWTGTEVAIASRQFDTAPFVTNCDYMEGLLTRLSTAPLLNVTAGGGSTVPSFLIAPK